MEDKNLPIWEKLLMKNINPIEALQDAITTFATEEGKGFSAEMYREFVESAEKLHSAVITMYVMEMAVSFKDDPKMLENIPGYIQACKDDFARSLDGHIRINFKANNLTMSKSHNEQVGDEIKKELGL